MDNDSSNRHEEYKSPYEIAGENALREFIKEFQIPEMKQIAMMVFAEYAALGGDLFSEEDTRRMKEIVEEAYVSEDDNQKMIAKGVNDLRVYIRGKTQRALRRKILRPLPRRRKPVRIDLEEEVVPVSKEGRVEDDLREEIEELEENRYALRERRLPIELSGHIARDERRTSVIRRLNEWSEEQAEERKEGKKQA